MLDGKRVFLTGASGFIGTNLVDLLLAAGAEVVNADIAAPLDPRHAPHWRRCDVLDGAAVRGALADADPHHVVHLAARADTSSDDLADYAVNSVGTARTVAATTVAPSLERFLLISTQYVVGPGVAVESETTYAPHTAYGASKVAAEQALRADPPAAMWAILRPTNVWGPWHLRYQRQFWRVLRRGLYVHPGAPDPVRSYGYVGSVCLQIMAALLVPEERIHARALYVGDDPMQLSVWVDAFSVALRGGPARRVPRSLLVAMARTGDLANRAGLPSPINSTRLTSMTQDYPTPMHRTWDALGGRPTVPLDRGVAETAAWLADGRPPPARGWLPTGAAPWAQAP